MNKVELDIKIEAYRQADLIKKTRSSWLIFMAREDSGMRSVTALDKSNRPIKLKVVSDKNNLRQNDGP